MPIALSDFDHTLTEESTYEELARYGFDGIKKQMGTEEISAYISKLEGTPILDIINLKKFIKYRGWLLEKLKSYDATHVISKNPFVKDFVTDEFRDTSYPTIEVEIEKGKLTGKISKIVSKGAVMESENILNGHAEIFVFSDGHSGDGKIIKYLTGNNYKLINTCSIDSVYKYEFHLLKN